MMREQSTRTLKPENGTQITQSCSRKYRAVLNLSGIKYIYKLTYCISSKYVLHMYCNEKLLLRVIPTLPLIEVPPFKQSVFLTTDEIVHSFLHHTVQPSSSLSVIFVLSQAGFLFVYCDSPTMRGSSNILLKLYSWLKQQAQSFSISHKSLLLRCSYTSIEIHSVELSPALLPLYTSTSRDTSFLLLKDEAR
eukprot:scaffold4766_cov160-Skeletonema_dohrnii-CCMP3373.AAC.3